MLAGAHRPLAGAHRPLAGAHRPLAGAHRPLAGIVKAFSDLVISESYRGSEHALPDPKNCMVAVRANVGCYKY
jgi:hypothetical protein